MLKPEENDKGRLLTIGIEQNGVFANSPQPTDNLPDSKTTKVPSQSRRACTII